jgi:hypothetical protein
MYYVFFNKLKGISRLIHRTNGDGHQRSASLHVESRALRCSLPHNINILNRRHLS